MIKELKKIPLANTLPLRPSDYPARKNYYFKEVISKIEVDKNHPLYPEKLDICSNFGLMSRNYYLTSGFFGRIPEAHEYLNKEIFLRSSILQSLKKADEFLCEHNMRLLILSGYRHPRLQAMILEEASRKIGSEKASRLLSDPCVYSPHTTGAAFDLEVWDENKRGALLTKIEGIVDRMTLEKKRRFTLREREVRDNRRMVHNLLATEIILGSEKFVPHPFEYWHYGRNERLSAFFSERNHPVFYDALLR